MSLLVVRSGLQTTVQGAPRDGLRHFAVPAGGAADALSLALANRLVGNSATTAALEVTLSGAEFRATAELSVAVTGAECDVFVNRDAAAMHRTLRLHAGDSIRLGGARLGARSYLAIAGGIDVPTVLGSLSTSLAAAFGGFEGRALSDGDELTVGPAEPPEIAETPDRFRPLVGGEAVLRAVSGPDQVDGRLFEIDLTVGERADRMGLRLSGLELSPKGSLPSAPVFPGCLQCPPDGSPYLLGVDAQTTGGYAQIAQVARVDRHRIGQLRPGDSLRLAERTGPDAAADCVEKIRLWSAWLPEASLAIR